MALPRPKSPNKPQSDERNAGLRDSRRQPVPGVERVAAWEHLSWLRAGFSTRQGGRSSVYGAQEQNLGWTSEDDAATVAENRKRFAAAVCEGAAMPLVTSHQIHSAEIRDLETETEPLMAADGKASVRADGMLSRSPGRLLGILTADCVPVLIADTRTHAVAAFHAGWRGTLAQIVERGVGSLGTLYGSRPEDLTAAIGPCIGACCYSVGDEVRSGFERQFTYARKLFSAVYSAIPVASDDQFVPPVETAGTREVETQLHVDLVEANRQQLLDAGVPLESISVLAECTACSRLPNGLRKYYSHRAEHGFTGRMLSAIGALA